MCNASIAASVPLSSATNRLQPFSISIGTRARNLASRKLLASSRPVETQLFIQTRATSSYSSSRAGRIKGGGMERAFEKSGANIRHSGGLRNARLFENKKGGLSAPLNSPFVTLVADQ